MTRGFGSDWDMLEHSGFVGIIGRPNVGKSTLLNMLAARKLAIVSDKPQTTRHAIRAVLNGPRTQMVMIDTPGIHKPRDGLGRRLNAKVRKTMGEVDVVLFLLDGEAGIGGGDAFIAAELAELKTPIIMGLNKIDALDETGLVDQASAAGRLLPEVPVENISALTGSGVESLVGKLTKLLPSGPKYYPDDSLTDQPESRLIGELIREKLINKTHEELPYAVAVEIVEILPRDKKDIIDVYAKIHVERESQKGIIIGEKGSRLAEVGREARAEIEALLGSQIYLDLIVKVTKGWRRKEQKVEEFGY